MNCPYGKKCFFENSKLREFVSFPHFVLVLFLSLLIFLNAFQKVKFYEHVMAAPTSVILVLSFYIYIFILFIIKLAFIYIYFYMDLLSVLVL